MELFGLGVWDIGLRLGLGVVVGFCIGLTGVGGGVLGLQVMTLVLRMDPVAAVGTTGLYIFLTKISAAFHHARLGNIAWKPSVRLLAGAIPANIAASRWISAQGGDAGFMEALQTFIGAVILFSAGVMVVDLVNTLRRKAECGERNMAAKLDGHGAVQTVSTLLLGALIGGLVGATSVGGGVLLVPMLITLFGLGARRTVGTSIIIALVLSLATALVYGKTGEVVVSTAVVMATGSLLGVRGGARLSARIPECGLRATMVAVILVAAIMMLMKGP